MTFLNSKLLAVVFAAAATSAFSQTGASTNAAAFQRPSEIIRPPSVFDDKTSNVRDPFFPRTTRAPYSQQQVKPEVKETARPVEVRLLLKGILGSAGSRLALINNQTFAEGESGSVKVPGGQVRIRCVKINERSAVIAIEGRNEQTELRLIDK